MNPRAYVATTGRILKQLKADHRTVGMIVMVPSLLMTLLYFIYQDYPTFPGEPKLFDRIGVSMLGVLPFIVMFLITAITMQRERVSGTLERLMTTPMAKFDLLAGYGTAFSVAAGIQAAVAVAVSFGLLGLDTKGAAGFVILVAILDAVLGVALGLLASAFAKTEFQAVQFMPVIALPQFFLCGLLVPRDQLPNWLEAISNVLPLSYAVDALGEVAHNAEATKEMWMDVGIVAGFAVVALAIGAATLRRRTE
ncbi:MAG: ABC transporter permease [Nocardiaceae bacterium]|nr:ABC transporter permease [Nocardiaceae bacterium]